MNAKLIFLPQKNIIRLDMENSLKQENKIPNRTYLTWDLTYNFFLLLLTVHLSIFISVINQLDAQNFILQ